MAVVIDPLLCMVLSGVMFFCSGFASYGCYRCFTDMEDVSRNMSSGSSELGLLKKSKERYRLRLFRRRPSTVSSDATIYSVHSSEIWSRQTTPKGSLTPSPLSSAGLIRAYPTTFVNASQIRGWTIKEEQEPEDEINDSRRKSAPT